MKKIIFSLYIDIPDGLLDEQPPYDWDTEQLSKTKRTQILFKTYENWLERMHRKYSQAIGVEYRLYRKDEFYNNFEKTFLEKYPQITGYNIVNFYKIHLMYELMKEGYDEILYLDFDAVPVTNESFFERWNLQESIAILTNRRDVEISVERLKKQQGPSNRSPSAKYWNTKAMLLHESVDVDLSFVYNTGIVGISSENLKKLDYFGGFDKTISLMNELKYEEPNMFPDTIRDLFGWDNETIWGYKTALNNLEVDLLDNTWHFFFDKNLQIPHNAKIIHCINKRFEYLLDWCILNEKVDL